MVRLFLGAPCHGRETLRFGVRQTQRAYLLADAVGIGRAGRC